VQSSNWALSCLRASLNVGAATRLTMAVASDTSRGSRQQKLDQADQADQADQGPRLHLIRELRSLPRSSPTSARPALVCVRLRPVSLNLVCMASS
jgi:hypothetical protein